MEIKMSNGQASPEDANLAYYDYLCDTADMARDLTERLIFLDESQLASTANLLRVQLQQMLDSNVDDQIANIDVMMGVS
jgi:hypothetical protein